MELPESFDDVIRYFGSTFIQVRDKKKGGFKWIYASEWGQDDNGKLVIYATTHQGQRDHTKFVLTSSDDYDLTLPDSQYYFTGEEALFLRRASPRINVKALSKQNSELLNPLKLNIPANFQGGFPDYGHWIYMWLRALNTKVPEVSFAKCLEILNNSDKIFSLPLYQDRQWCISKSPCENDDFTLWYRMTPVCNIRQGVGIMLSPTFTQEVKDLFPQLFPQY
jgi:hypothetical protein